MKNPELSAVIPVYKAESNLQELYTRLVASLEKTGSKFEIILVDDGSPDSSWRAIQELSRKDDRVKGIQLARNFGQHNALLCGIIHAHGDIIVTLDDDLQNPPEEIPKLISKIGEGYDVVYGVPQKKQHGIWRNAASFAANAVLQHVGELPAPCQISGFSAFRTKIRNAFSHYQAPFVSIDVLLSWGTTNFAAVIVRHDPRKIGTSRYTFKKLSSHLFNMLTGFTTLPLQLASWLGFLFTIFGIGILIYVVGRYLLQGSKVPGFAFLASTIAIFSGVQLFTLGIIGEYLSRIHFRSMRKPPFVIGSSLNCDDKTAG